ncbi:DUF5681 domain-containing protein [Bradyrhizobium sp. DASA03120]|uniref:DUF5681 domain-containing protein n=1 Tax=Bradyrhizobium sp. SMVTL-02 TaxID=3395917 RepID=UPI003F6FF783
MSAGYGNPPKGSRFKKGHSGNAAGRPRQAVRRVSIAMLFRKVANEQITIELDGGQVMMTRWEALLRQIHTLALNKGCRRCAVAPSDTSAISGRCRARR